MKNSNFSVRGNEQQHFSQSLSEQLLYKGIVGALVLAITICILTWF